MCRSTHITHKLIRDIRFEFRLSESLFIAPKCNSFTSPYLFYSVLYRSLTSISPSHTHTHTDTLMTPSQIRKHSIGGCGTTFSPGEACTVAWVTVIRAISVLSSRFPSRERSYNKYDEDLFPSGDVGGQKRVMAKAVITFQQCPTSFPLTTALYLSFCVGLPVCLPGGFNKYSCCRC